MQKNLIFGLILCIIIVIFALQNAHDVKIILWLWEVQGSLAIVIILTLLFGAILGIIFSIPALIRKNKIIEQLKEESEHKKSPKHDI